MKLQALILIVLAGASSCLGNLALKHSRSIASGASGFMAGLVNPYFIAGLMCYGINVVLFAKALDVVPVSIAYPILAGVGFALLAVASSVLFAEHLSSLQLAGLALTLTGIAFLARDLG